MARIVAICPKYPPKSRVGAWLSTHRCLVELVARGHRVEVGTLVGRPHPPYDIDGITVRAGNYLAEELTQGADVIISHTGDDGRAHRAALAYGIPSVRMGHGGKPGADQLDGSALVVWNAHSFAAEIGWDGPQIVVHPPVFPDEYRTTRGHKVTLVNLSKEKGVDTFIDCAEALPDVEFLGVFGGYGWQEEVDLPNVETMPPVVDAREVYAQTAVLLMPSERETWGRVGVEAFASGIPVVAHPTPGLREALGHAGIFADRNDTDAWVAAIGDLLSDPGYYARCSADALERSAELDPTVDLERFADAVEGVIA